MIYEFLHGRCQTVKLRDTYSHSICVASGIPRKSVLGPTLLALHVGYPTCRYACRNVADDRRRTDL